MGNQFRFSCFLIGSDGLLIECAELLLRRGHEARGVISGADRVVRWARDRGLTVVDPETYLETLRREPFDYLFSITHLELIPDEAIALAKRGVVNFHDGPLPRYAGLNAPAWALMRGETSYGVSWHLVAAKVDSGDILKQVTFDIAADETSLSLNTKCFAHGIESFDELLLELSSGTAVAKQQRLAERTYFGRGRRPDAAAVIDWTSDARSTSALVRALDFGDRYANDLGVAKVYAKGESFIVTRAEERPASVAAPPGTVVFAGQDVVEIATGDGVLAVTAAATLDGRPLDLPELATRLELDRGIVLENLSTAARERLGEADKQTARSESFWVERLRSSKPAVAPYADAKAARSGRHADVPLALPPGIQGEVERHALLVAGFAVYCARLSEQDAFAIGFSVRSSSSPLELAPWFVETVPLCIDVDADATFRVHCERARVELEGLRARGPYLRDLVARNPDLRKNSTLVDGSAWPVCIAIEEAACPTHELALVISGDGAVRLSYDVAAISESRARAMARQLSTLLEHALRQPDAPVAGLALVSDDERARLLVEQNRTERAYRALCSHRFIEEQVERTPEATALVCEGKELTYRELDRRANQLAAHLRSLGVGPDVLVGIHLRRSLDLVVATLGTWKAGGAYLPLDPDYPEERLAFVLEDAKVRVLVTDESGALRVGGDTQVVGLERDAACIDRRPTERVEGGAGPQNLAYVIYTSGSTGVPKGVMIEHRNVANFFAGMDDRIPHEKPGSWLSVTSLSFDISLLELFWPLTHGFRVVVYEGHPKPDGRPARRRSRQPMAMSLFYFASDESTDGADKYELLLKGAKFADQHGFAAVWTPERHFHAFGGLYPNPAVTGAALAVLTENVQIRAGSVVLPLHHPARVVEAWSVVDNLSHGRVGISFASGWQPNDFILRPETFKESKKVLFRDLEVVKRLWRGESVEFVGPTGGPVAIRTLPRPLQAELPVWITSAGNVETYKMAGQIGANVLTHLLGQSIAELAPKIRAYRDARREHGHDPDAGIVSLMLHTFVGDDEDAVRAAVREPLKRYLGSSLELLKHYAWAFPAFSRPKDVSNDAGDDLAGLTPDEREALLEHAFDRYYQTSGLFGRPESCHRMLDDLAAIGVNEAACLIDFGVATDVVLRHLEQLDRVRAVRAREASANASETDGDDDSIAALVHRHRVTHLQCTPSMARMLLDQSEVRSALAELRCWLIGGEALNPGLAAEVRAATSARLFNMYGPTEATVWSTTHEIAAPEASIPIGRPIANTRIYVLDRRGAPVPFGVPGELYIAGDGVARGYLGREELTRERFVPDPFFGAGRMYRTGDLASFREDGVLDFFGRRDQQIKIRGHRVELGEIEAVMAKEPEIAECVVSMREDIPGDQRLVAYVVGRGGKLDGAALRERLRARLPDFMIPAYVVSLAELPQTPNRKVDRRALPAPGEVAAPPAAYVAPTSEIERAIAHLWQELLGKERIGTEDNFFDVGGHSLLVVRMHRKLRELVGQPVALTDLYRFPTIRSLTDFLSRSDASSVPDAAIERAERRRQMSPVRRRSPHV